MPSGLIPVITAAGESSRMGGFPKPLLTFDGDRFVDRLLSTYQSTQVADPVVVLGHEATEVSSRADLDNATILENEDYERGMLSSVQCGVEYATTVDAPGILLNPVDCPLIPTTVIETMLTAYEDATTQIDVFVPTVNGGRGHPPIFTASTFDPLLNAPEDQGARAVVRADTTATREVPVADDRIFVDIDTPSEYWAAVKAYEPT